MTEVNLEAGKLAGGSPVNWAELQPHVWYIPRDVVLEVAVGLYHWLPGNIIEFGVYRGTSNRILRRTLSQCKREEFGGPRKKIYACDSFEGLPEKFAELEPGTWNLEHLRPNYPESEA